MIEVILKRFEKPDEDMRFPKGKFETVTLGGITIGRASYDPGWKWFDDVGPGSARPFVVMNLTFPYMGAGKYAK